MKDKKVTVIGAQGDGRSITLYPIDGNPIVLPARGHRVNEIMAKITKPLSMRKPVEIDLADYSAHRVVEEKSGGFIRFFKRKVREVGTVFGVKSDTQESTFIGRMDIGPDETIVAEVNGVEIPGMEKIDVQIDNAAYGEGMKGFTVFMKRLANVIQKRGHSVEELLNFMEKGDLPIADDGSVIGYKTLMRLHMKEDDTKSGFTFADKHSGRVHQRVGSRVSMPESKVDASRYTQCSTGLHIARRSYLAGYMGDVVCLAKIAPEDIIAVPYDQPSKMRVCAYHLVAELPQSAVAALGRNQAMTKDEACAKILADVIKGDHVGVLEDVRVGMGDNRKIKVVKNKKAVKFLGAGENGLAQALEEKEGENLKPVDIAAVSQEVESNVKTRMKMTEQQKEVERLALAGHSLSVIAKNVGVSRRTVGRWIDKFSMDIGELKEEPVEKKADKPKVGVTKKGAPKKKPAVSPATDEMTKEQRHVKSLIEQGHTNLTDIARAANVSRRTVGRWIEKFDLKLSKEE